MRHLLSLFLCMTLRAQQVQSDLERDFQYWKSFDRHITRLKNDRSEEQQRVLQSIDDQVTKERSEWMKERKEKIDQSIKEYEQTLNGQNDDNQLLNIALLHLRRYDIDGTSKVDLEKADATLLQHSQRFPQSKNQHRRSYLQFEVGQYQGKTRLDLLEKILDQPSSADTQTIIYAALHLGDTYFRAEKPQKAQDAFEKALDRANDEQKRDLLYRLVWCTYRSGRLAQSIGYARQLLESTPQYSSSATLQRIQRDTAELMGHSLYEMNDDSITNDYLRRQNLKTHAPLIVSTIIRRYIDEGLDQEANHHLNKAMKNFGLSSELPRWYAFEIEVNQRLSREDALTEAKRKFISLADHHHPWRKKFANLKTQIALIEELAPDFSTDVLRTLSQKGINHQSVVDLNKVSSMADGMIRYFPSHRLVPQWTSAKAEAQLFLGRFDMACPLFDTLIKGTNLLEDQLDHTMFLKAQCLERKLDLYQQREPKRIDQAVAELETSIHEYANRFPKRTRAVDLLLMFASRLRDLQRMSEATQVWNRVLLSAAQPQQRTAAIRGLIHTAILNKDDQRLVELAESHLRSEDWKKMPMALKNELLGVLSQAAQASSQKLASNGQMQTAGNQLLRSADLVPEIPKKEKILRDGAYMLAVGGEWSSAQTVAEEYLRMKYRQYAADMTYLKARSLEQQMNFDLAAKAYLDFAKKYPDHEKSFNSLRRIEQLASADDAWGLAGESLEILSTLEKNRSMQIKYLERAFYYFEKATLWKEASRVASQFNKQAQGWNQKLQQQMMVAKIEAAKGFRERASGQLLDLEKTIPRGQESAIFQLRLLAAQFLVDQIQSQINDSLDDNLARRALRIYDQMAQVKDPILAAQARFRAGELCEWAAEQATDREKYRVLAQKYHSENAIALKTTKASQTKNSWAEKSGMRLSFLPVDKIENENTFVSSPEFPSQWSLQ